MLLVTIAAALCILVPAAFVLRPTFDTVEEHHRQWASGSVGVKQNNIAQAIHGEVIMPKLENATIKCVFMP